ncbi:HAD-like protein [Coprinopsis marcescibilis]|uniref:HAD-like protein n=1 Tax=Coprinopsis marcescibilis TaxID=230819 RepID=A0A5C3KPP8_COPMA|nr:HAD-like protein [Coprinopsis marcescibilis]
MAPYLAQYSALVFDLGDVLFQWSPVTNTPISPKVLHTIMGNEIWYAYECGQISQEECYFRLADRFSLNAEDIREAFNQAKESLTADFDLVNFIRQLKQSNPHLRIFACSNVSRPDFEALRLKPADWGIFERIFTSGDVGERKPNLGIYRHLIASTGIDPRRAIFVDDKLENVFSAQSLGFQGIVFDSVANVKQTLLNLLCDPVARGSAYLQSNQGKLQSVLGKTEEDSVILHENFAQLLILEATDNPSLVHLVEPKNETGLWNFFHDPKLLSKEDFPYDLDTTSMAHTVLRSEKSAEGATRVMNEIVKNLTNDGLPLTYFDPRRPRLDAGVCVCVVTIFYAYGRGSEVSNMVQWIFDILVNRAFTNGTYYYIYPEYFLYAIVRLLNSTTDRALHAKFTPILKECIQERIGVSGDALALGMRIIVCNHVGIRNDIDMRTMLKMQCADGSWEMSWVYRLPSKNIKVGNRGLATAVAIKAIGTFPRKEKETRRKSIPVSVMKLFPQLRSQMLVFLPIALTFPLTFIISRHLQLF